MKTFFKSLILLLSVMLMTMAVSADSNVDPADIDKLIVNMRNEAAFGEKMSVYLHTPTEVEPDPLTGGAYSFSSDLEAMQVEYAESERQVDYRVMLKFNNTELLTEDYKYIVVVYSLKTESAYKFSIWNSPKQGEEVIIAEGDSVSTDGFVVSEPLDISVLDDNSKSIQSRWIAGNINTVGVDTADVNAELYIKELGFFKTAEDAEAYYSAVDLDKDPSEYEYKSRFTDVTSDNRYAEAIDDVSKVGIVKATSDTTFGPSQAVTRWQAALYYSRLMTGYVNSDSYWASGAVPFDDVTNYKGAIQYVYQNGIMYGTSATTFSGKNNVTYIGCLVSSVRALGFDDGLDYPWGYYNKAAELGLTENMEISDLDAELNKAEFTQIIYNTLYATTAEGDTLYERSFGEGVELPEYIIAEGECGDALFWSLNEFGTLKITGEGEMPDYDDFKDTPWYEYISDIKYVYVDDEVEYIGMCAFRNLENVDGAYVGSAVAEIGDYAFDNCVNMTFVDLPGSLDSIGAWAFGYCRRLEKIELYDYISYIGDYAFYKCTSLPTVNIPARLKKINDGTFWYCGKLLYAPLHDGITSIGECAFSGCGINVQVIPDSVTSIGAGAFRECGELKSVTVPESVKNIGDEAFETCSDELVMRGYADTYAEEYAEDNDIPFEVIDASEGGDDEEDDDDGLFYGDGKILIGSPMVDGKLESMYKNSLVLEGLGTGENAYKTDWWYTCQADVYFLYDDEYVYICAEVTDDDVLTKGEAFATGSNPYQNDNIEFRISLDGSPDTVKIAVDAYGYACYGLAANYAKYDYSKIEYATTYSDNFYTVEVAIPYAEWGIDLQGVGKFGFTYQLNDINADGKHVNITSSFVGEGVKVPVFYRLSSMNASSDSSDNTRLTVRLSDVMATPGDTIELDLLLKNNPGIIGLRAAIEYDEDAFTLLDVVDYGLLGGATHSDDLSANPYTLLWLDGTAEEDYSDDGVIATLRFKVNEDAKPDSYVFDVYLSKDDVIDYELETMKFNVIDGSALIGYLGDANGDGKLNIIDLAYLQRYIARWVGFDKETVRVEFLDVYADGKINSLDDATLARHFARWIGYETIPVYPETTEPEEPEEPIGETFAVVSDFSDFDLGVIYFDLYVDGEMIEDVPVTVLNGWEFEKLSAYKFSMVLSEEELYYPGTVYHATVYEDHYELSEPVDYSNFSDFGLVDVITLDTAADGFICFEKGITTDDGIGLYTSNDTVFYIIEIIDDPAEATVTVFNGMPQSASVEYGDNTAIYADKVGSAAYTASVVFIIAPTAHEGFAETEEEPEKGEYLYNFTDVTTTDRFYDAVKFVVDNGLFNGTSATTFTPDASMNRAMFATVLGRYSTEDVSSYKESTMADVAVGQWYTSYVEWAVANGYMFADENNQFGVNGNITVEAALEAFAVYFGFAGSTYTADKAADEYSDFDEVSDRAKEAVIWAVENGVYEPVGDMLDSTAGLTRAEVAMLFYNCYLRNFDVSAGYGGYSDVTEAQASYEAMCYVIDNDLFLGLDAYKFKPDESVTRAFLVTAMGRVENADVSEYVDMTPTFTDVAADEWYAPYIEWSAANGIVNGIGNDLFGVDGKVSIQQACVIWARLTGMPTAEKSSGLTLDDFYDAEGVSDWAKEGVSWAVENGIYVGEGGYLDPSAYITRAQLAQIIYNCYRMFG